MKHILLAILIVCLGIMIGQFLIIHKLSKPEYVEIQQSVVEKVDTLDSWDILQLAIAMTESKFNPAAIGTSNDYGIYQITPIYVAEVNRLLGTEEFVHDQAFDVRNSVEMFNILQSYKNPDKDIETAIYYHNKSPYYKSKVLQNYQLVLRYEYLRKVLKDYNLDL